MAKCSKCGQTIKKRKKTRRSYGKSQGLGWKSSNRMGNVPDLISGNLP